MDIKRVAVCVRDEAHLGESMRPHEDREIQSAALSGVGQDFVVTIRSVKEVAGWHEIEEPV